MQVKSENEICSSKVEKPAEKIDFGEEIRSHVESLKIPYDARKLIEVRVHYHDKNDNHTIYFLC